MSPPHEPMFMFSRAHTRLELCSIRPEWLGCVIRCFAISSSDAARVTSFIRTTSGMLMILVRAPSIAIAEALPDLVTQATH